MLKTAEQFTYALERGWYDGGQLFDRNPTLDGVTDKTYRAWRIQRGMAAQSVRHMTPAERVAIYQTYWDEAQTDRLARIEPLAVSHFDHAFNAGVAAAMRVLQGIIGATPDGVWGPRTAAALTHALETLPARQLARKQLFARLQHYTLIGRLNKAKRAAMPAWNDRLLRIVAAYPATYIDEERPHVDHD